MDTKEILVGFIKSLTNEEAKRVIDFLKNAEKLPNSGKEQSE